MTVVRPAERSAAAVCAASVPTPACPSTSPGRDGPRASIMSPPARSTTRPSGARTVVVRSRVSGPREGTTAAAVRSLVVEAGVRGWSAATSSRCAPVIPSRTVSPTDRPSRGSASAGASAERSAAAAGCGAPDEAADLATGGMGVGTTTRDAWLPSVAVVEGTPGAGDARGEGSRSIVRMPGTLSCASRTPYVATATPSVATHAITVIRRTAAP